MKILLHGNSPNGPENKSQCLQLKIITINYFNIISNQWIFFSLIFLPSISPIFLSHLKTSWLASCFCCVSVWADIKKWQRKGHYCKTSRLSDTHRFPPWEFKPHPTEEVLWYNMPTKADRCRLTTPSPAAKRIVSKKEQNKTTKKLAYLRENQPILYLKKIFKLWLLLFFDSLHHLSEK